MSEWHPHTLSMRVSNLSQIPRSQECHLSCCVASIASCASLSLASVVVIPTPEYGTKTIQEYYIQTLNVLGNTRWAYVVG